MVAIKWVTLPDGSRVRQFDFHPGEVVEFSLGWDRRLSPGDKLTSARFELDTTDTTFELFSPTNTDHRAQVWARGNPPIATIYIPVCHVTTVFGRQLRQSFRVEVKEP